MQNSSDFVPSYVKEALAELVFPETNPGEMLLAMMETVTEMLNARVGGDMRREKIDAAKSIIAKSTDKIPNGEKFSFNMLNLAGAITGILSDASIAKSIATRANLKEDTNVN